MYKTSAELKQEAKEMLSGRWKDAVILNIVPSIIQIITYVFIAFMVAITTIALIFIFSTFSTSDVSTSNQEDVYDNGFFDDFDDLDDFDDFEEFDDFDGNSNNSELDQLLNEASASFNVNSGGYFLSTALSLVISFISIGISFTFLDVLRNRDRKIRAGNDAFRVFNGKDFVPLLLTQVLTYVFTMLWSFLFVIPGLIKQYAYSQAPFIYKDLSEHGDTERVSANQYITESKLLMSGHKGRLFYIDLSFIGWHILAIMSFGIGYLWLNPYMNATRAAFYNNLSQNRYLNTDVANSVEDESETSQEDEWTNF